MHAMPVTHTPKLYSEKKTFKPKVRHCFIIFMVCNTAIKYNTYTVMDSYFKYI